MKASDQSARESGVNVTSLLFFLRRNMHKKKFTSLISDVCKFDLACQTDTC